MVEVNNQEEFDNIIDSGFGYIITNKQNSQIAHRTKCSKVDSASIEEMQKADIEVHWFSTLALAEKAFTQLNNCNICNPD